MGGTTTNGGARDGATPGERGLRSANFVHGLTTPDIVSAAPNRALRKREERAR
jgi:hypothetical protein